MMDLNRYRFLGFHQGLYGDIAMSTVAARALKQRFPLSHLTFIVGSDFAQIVPLLDEHPHIDSIYVTHKGRDGFDEWDAEWINKQQFTHIFNPLQDHNHSDPWWLHRVQTREICHMHGLELKEGDDAHIELTKWFNVSTGLEKHIAFAPYAGMYNPNNDKRLSTERAQEIVNLILKKGFKVLQVGGRNEPRLEGADYFDTNYFDSVRNILGCKMLLHTDTGLGWIISGYQFPQLGLYSHRYYGAEHVRSIQPVNPNGIYLDSDHVNNISLDLIEQKLDTLLT